MKKTFRLVSLLASFSVPFFAVAQSGINLNAITPYSNGVINFINYILVPILMAVAFIVFLWGIYKYFILGAADEKNREDGRQFALWGIIGFVIILSLWGIVNIFMGTLGLSATNAPRFPTIGGLSAPGGGTQTTGGSSVFGTSGTAGQSAALTQQYNTMQSICSANGDFSSQCQQAKATYLQDYNAVYPTTASYNTCISNGGDPAICQCEASGGVWSLNDATCSNGSTPQGTSATPSAFQACIDNGGSAAQCQCESRGGAWDLGNDTCSL